MNKKSICGQFWLRITAISGKQITVPKGQLIVTKSDVEGLMTYGSEEFCDLTGYSESELLGQSHKILHHPDVPKAYYKIMVDLNANRREFFGAYKSLTKQKDYYWCFVHVTPSYDGKNRLVGFQSITRPLKQAAIDEFSLWYQQMLDIERSNRTSVSVQFLFDQIAKKGSNYSEFLFSCKA